MNEKELLQELVQSVKNIQADMQNMQANMQAEMQNMRADISEIKDRTLKIEITLENETNKNIGSSFSIINRGNTRTRKSYGQKSKWSGKAISNGIRKL